MDDIDDIIWQHNKERAIESLYDDEMAMVDNYTRHAEISDYETILAVKIVL